MQYCTIGTNFFLSLLSLSISSTSSNNKSLIVSWQQSKEPRMLQRHHIPDHDMGTYRQPILGVSQILGISENGQNGSRHCWMNPNIIENGSNKGIWSYFCSFCPICTYIMHGTLDNSCLSMGISRSVMRCWIFVMQHI